jgi:hypothetical protein
MDDMAHYRKIDTRMWNDAKFRRLTPDAKLMFVLILTHPNLTSIGTMRHTSVGLGAEIGLTPEASDTAFMSLHAANLIEYDSGANCLVLPNFLRYNTPENPNGVKAWANAIEYTPECELKDKVLTHLRKTARVRGGWFEKAFDDAMEALAKSRQRELFPTADGETVDGWPKAVRDAMFNAVAKITGGTGSHVAKVVKELLACDPPYTPDEVLRLPAEAKKRNYTVAITLGQVPKMIGWVRATDTVPKPRSLDDLAEQAREKRKRDALERGM